MKKLILQAIVCVLIGAIVTGGFTYFAERMEKIGEKNGKKDTTCPKPQYLREEP